MTIIEQRRSAFDEFSRAARAIQGAAARLGLDVPAFRNLPGPEPRRFLRRHPKATIVYVSLEGRPLADIAADMAEGVLAANRVPDEDAAQLRSALLDSLP